jgi:hypothetical protein
MSRDNKKKLVHIRKHIAGHNSPFKILQKKKKKKNSPFKSSSRALTFDSAERTCSLSLSLSLQRNGYQNSFFNGFQSSFDSPPLTPPQRNPCKPNQNCRRARHGEPVLRPHARLDEANQPGNQRRRRHRVECSVRH